MRRMLHHELIPAAEAGSRRQMLVLHGLGDSLEGYRWLPEVLGLDWLNYRLVNAPDAYYMGFSWYDIYGDPHPGIVRSRKALAALLDSLEAEGWAPEETAVFGFSQGCVLALETGARHPKRLAGLVGISGYVHEPKVLLREAAPVAGEQRFLVTHGTLDPLLPIERSRDQVKQLQQAGWNIQWQEYAKEHTIQGREEIERIRGFLQDCFQTAPQA